MTGGGRPVSGAISEMQHELDALALALGRSVSLDELDGTLLGYSVQSGDVDAARIDAILTRQVPPAVLEYQRRFGVNDAMEPVRMPGNPQLQMSARTCVPVRRRRAVLALLWILDDDSPLDPAGTRTAQACADRLYELLDRPGPADPHRLLARLFGDDEPPDPQDLVRHTSLAGDRLLQFAVVGVRTTAGRTAAAALSASRSRTIVASATARGRRLVVIAVPSAGGAAGHELRPAHPSQVIGRSATFHPANTDPGTVSTLAAQAVAAADCLATDPALSASTAWDDLGLYRRLLLTTRLTDWPDSQPLPEYGRSAAMLRHTLEVYLDHAGDAARSIAALQIHRTTFYYRLDRLAQLYGVDLDDGLARTGYHLALKTRRLAAARDRYGWTSRFLERLRTAV